MAKNMWTYPAIDPVAFTLPFIDREVHWYGLMYLIGLTGAWALARYRTGIKAGGWTKEQVGDMVFYSAVGIIAGGRIGYGLFYGFEQWSQDFFWILRVYEGGMSFHGGLIGVLCAFGYMAWKTNRTFFQVADFFAPVAPIGLFFGRLGNFINGELWGRTTSADFPLSMVFPHVDQLPRHPSMLYEMVLEGFVLFVILWWYSAKQRPRMATSALFLLFYGVFRAGVEFVRVPDEGIQVGYLGLEWMTRGQLLTLPMVLLGFAMLVIAYKRNVIDGNIKS